MGMDEEFTFLPPPEAPEFRPRIEEFDDPISYINKIRPIAEKYGICRIVPPSKWRPPFSVDMNNFTFNPRVQILKELDAKTRVKLLFLQDLANFWRLQGVPFTLPVLEKKIVNLQALYTAMRGTHGTKALTMEQKWRHVTKRILRMKEINAVKTIHERLLKPYEIFHMNKDKYVKRAKISKAANPEESKAIQDHTIGNQNFCVKLLAYWRSRGVHMAWPIVEKKTLSLYDLHLAVLNENEEIDWVRVASKLGFSNSNSTKIIKEHYKRLVMPFLKFHETEPEQKDDRCCMKCLKGDSTDKNLLVCIKCGIHYHRHCVRPPVAWVPVEPWHCYSCTRDAMNKPREPYGFDQSENDYSLQEFGEMAVQFKEDHFGMSANDVPSHAVEKEYWRLLSNYDDDTVVEYGADINVQEFGMGFPTRTTDPKDEYANSKWNLNNIPVLGSSAYSYIGTNIPGVTIPWMYVGMCFSTFCWHIEDHWSYSINYLHWGEPKTWYGIPGAEAVNFENMLKLLAPQLFDGRPDLLHDLSTTLNPNLLMEKEIPVYRTDQRAGEFVVTFPRAYHAGFNQGFNFAEAVNFAPANWIAIGRTCIDHYASTLHSNVFSHDELVCKMALRADELDKTLAKAVLQDMIALVKVERANREIIEISDVEKLQKIEFENLPDDSRQCHYCKTTCYLSAVTCDCQKMFCVKDIDKMKSCTCPASKYTFQFRFDMEELWKMLNKLHSVQQM